MKKLILSLMLLLPVMVMAQDADAQVPNAALQWNRSFYDNDRIPRYVLLNSDLKMVTVWPEESAEATPMEIIEFTVEIGGNTYVCTGDQFSKEAVMGLSRLRMGASIKLVDIKAKDKKGSEWNLKPICVYLN